MKCPYCQSFSTRVVDTRRDPRGNMRRRRECKDCKRRFSTVERPVLTHPLIVKKDKRREEFDRQKILSGLRIACARRPVSVKDMEHIADRVEYVIQKRGRAEFHSRAIGDVVVEELRQLDEVAYIRYAIVYLGLDDLEAIRKEIDAIREQRR